MPKHTEKEEEMEEGAEGEEEDEEETKDFGPDFNPTYFEFLIQEKPEEFYEGQFDLNRPFKASLNFLDNPHGSVKLYQGDTCALCAVYGPTEVRMPKELPHRAAIDVLYRPKITGISAMSQATGWDSITEERSIEMKLTGILESVIFLEDDMGAGFNIILHEFENDGCLFSTCVNAVSLALLNAGCSLRCTFAAVTILVNQETNILIVDPAQSQINNGFDALLTFVFSNNGDILYTGLEGKTTTKLISLCVRQAKVACNEIFKFHEHVQLQECSSFIGKNKQELKTGIKKEEEDVKMKLEDLKLEVEDEDELDENYEDVDESSDPNEEEGEVVDDSSDS